MSAELGPKALAEFVEAGCRVVYGRNWDGPPEKAPGDEMKDVWRNLARKAQEPVLAALRASCADQTASPVTGIDAPAPHVTEIEGSSRFSAAERAGFVPAHRFEALKREAQDHAFNRALAEKTLVTVRARWAEAATKALAGDTRLLKRVLDTQESPKPIYGSGAPPLSADGGRDA